MNNDEKKGPETLKEISFQQAYGRDLIEAREWCRKYEKTQNDKDINQAWDLYYHVFRRINKELPHMMNLELQEVSPKLMQCQDLELAVPGTYSNEKPIIRIHKINPILNVIPSKQRPRKLSILGDNGQEYQFLLKGHEDLRQDERVMQLFELINTLLSDDLKTSRFRLKIERYPVIPLAPECGIIGWVQDCDTFHNLIRDYREMKKTPLNMEHRLMLQMAPDYDNLTLIQKVEVFLTALESTSGFDMAKILWLKSKDAEVND
jgi:FKBP12-rapamycin complex-associated protein